MANKEHREGKESDLKIALGMTAVGALSLGYSLGCDLTVLNSYDSTIALQALKGSYIGLLGFIPFKLGLDYIDEYRKNSQLEETTTTTTPLPSA